MTRHNSVLVLILIKQETLNLNYCGLCSRLDVRKPILDHAESKISLEQLA